MKNWNLKRMLALALAAVMVLSTGISGVQAAPTEQTVSFTEIDSISADLIQGSAIQNNEPAIAADEMVRAMIVLEGESAAEKLGLSDGYTKVSGAAEYRGQLETQQAKVADEISRKVLKGKKLDVVWNLTLMTNAICANVAYGDLDEIAKLEGVAKVYLETPHQPLQADVSNIIAQEMTGTDVARETFGYTGAGTRIAVIDTGTDPDHQSFDGAAFEYALALNAAEAGLSVEEYTESLDLLDKEDIAAVLDQLNVSDRYEGLTADDLYKNSKMPFNFNYIDGDLNISHDFDDMGSHGSHVAGIAAANRYIPTGLICDFDGDGDFDMDDAQALMNTVALDVPAENLKTADFDGDGRLTENDVTWVLDALTLGSYADAAETVAVTGVAPDAQLLTMKVFGVAGGAYPSDYMAATEDAIVLGCEAVNLSLGAAAPGYASASETNAQLTAYIDDLFEQMEKTGTVVCIAAGNSGNWADMDDAYGMMYADEAGAGLTSDPATYTNALSVASADNVGQVTDRRIWVEANGASMDLTLDPVGEGFNLDWITLDPTTAGKTFEAVFVGDPTELFAGEEQTDAAIYGGSVADFVDVTGKIVFVARGNMVAFADKHTNAALAGAAGVVIYNNVSDPIYASISGSTATIPCGSVSLETAKAIFELFGGREGTFGVRFQQNVDKGEGKAAAMSDFSSWGTTGGLAIKPEITAPGGNIYSVNGVDPSGSAYELMSGTSMACPHTAGLSALALQYIQDKGLTEVTGVSQRFLGQSLLMSTAEPVIETASGLPYSVRNQGAGLASIENVILADAYVMIDGLTDGKVKAELGDGTEARTFTFTLNDLAGKEQTYVLSAQMMTPATVEIDGYALSSNTMAPLAADVTFSTGETVTVPANGSVSVTVTISVPEAVAAEMEELGHINGFFLEGYIYAAAQADAEGAVAASHSIPVMGWYGGWTDASMYEGAEFLDYTYGGQPERPAHMNDMSTNIISWCPVGYGSGMYYTGNVYAMIDTAETGHVIAGDSRYLPERNAVSSENAIWQLYALFPSLMRNAADYKITITDSNTGEVYYFNDFNEWDNVLVASFYHPSIGGWNNSTTSSPVGLEDWTVTDLEGNPLPDGTEFTIELACAPEYYVGEGTHADWSKVGKGAYQYHSFRVDNTKPELANVNNALVMRGDKLYYTVQDDNYIAAVILLTGDASAAVDYSFPDMDADQQGLAVTGSLDLTGYRELFGDKAAIAVCDYAGNETYYAINLGGEGASYGDFIAYQYGSESTGSWISFSEGVSFNETALFSANVDFTAAEYVNGLVFAQDAAGNLYGIEYADFLANSVDLETTFITKLSTVYQDFAYNYADGNLYALNVYMEGKRPSTEIISINLKGEYYDPDRWTTISAYQEDWAQSRGGLDGMGLAIDDNGNFYLMGTVYDSETETLGQTATLWKAEDQGGWPGPFKQIGDTGVKMDYLQSITWDHNTESLYWAQFAPVSWFQTQTQLMKVNVETAEAEKVGDLTFETCALMAPLTAEAAAKPEHANVPDFDASVIPTPILTSSAISLGVGKSEQLTLLFDPWYASDKNVVWSSSDESIVTVDQDGVVTAVADGKAMITVAAAADESKFAECEVTVASLTLNIDGIMSRTEGGINSVFGAKLYNYGMDKGVATLTQGDLISAPEQFQGYGLNITSVEKARGSLWTCEYNNVGMIYEIDAETGVIKDMFEPIDGDVLYGLSYSEKTDLFAGIMNFYLYVDIPMDHEMQEEIVGSYDEERHEFMWHKFDMSAFLAESDEGFLTGETDNGSVVDVVFAGITSMDNTDGTSYYSYMDYKGGYCGESDYVPDLTYVILDNVGRLWYIDEVMGMTKETDDWGNTMYFGDKGMIAGDNAGVFSLDYEDGTSSVFVLRAIEDTTLTDMYRQGTLPRITYHFSDIYYAGKSEEGAPLFVLSLYDYWNNGTTNELYLYVASMGTGEWGMDENWNYVELKTPDALYELGDTGFGNIIATISEAEVIDGLPPVLGGGEAETLNVAAVPYKYAVKHTAE